MALILFFLLLILPVNTIAFTEETYCQILNDVVCFCPTELQTFIKSNMEKINEGIGFMDRRGARATTNSTEVMSIYNYTTKKLQQKPVQYEEDVAKRLGMLASFVAFAINPSRKTRSNYSQATKPDLVVYDGFQKIDTRRLQKLLVTQTPINEAYNKAVNEISDFWMSVWKDGNRKLGKLCAKGKTIDYSPKRGFPLSRSSASKQSSEWDAFENSGSTTGTYTNRKLVNDRSDLRGCCSYHDGVCGCQRGRVKCCDGTLSPTCRCE